MALLSTQLIAVLATIAYVGIASWILLLCTSRLVGLRVTSDDEREGLDIALHGEQVF
jgi:Amt family ammonium transporter